MLLTIEPLTIVFAAVDPAIHSVPVLAIVVEVALVRLTIIVHVASLPV